MTTFIADVGPQLARAAAGTDPRGWLVFEYLPEGLQRAEDSTAAADRAVLNPRGFTRPASSAEKLLLAHLGYTVPAELTTHVKWLSRGVRRRTWPALESQEVSAP